MALSPSLVEEFLASEKAIAASERMSWRKRNDAIVVARLGVQAQGVTVGEVVMIVSLVVARDWNFKLLRRGDELLRWDLTVPPSRHSNPPGRPAGFPGKVRNLEHEHRWVQGLGMNCALELDLSETHKQDHRRAFEAFCDRANMTCHAVYQAPPPPGEQLQLG